MENGNQGCVKCVKTVEGELRKMLGDKRIYLVDYLGYTNKQGEPIGHALKLLRQYVEILKENFEVYVVAPKEIIRSIEKQEQINSIELKYHLIPYDGEVNFGEKAYKTYKRIWNIASALSTGKKDVIWFYNVDFMLFKYLYYFHRNCSNIVCTMYQQDYGVKKSRIYYTVLSRMKHVFNTLDTFKADCNYTIIPDYYFDNKYEKYISPKKKEQVLCVGTMGGTKKLEKLIEIFSKIDYKLDLIGCFRDNNRFEKLLRKCKDNISISNKYLSDEEFYTKIGESKYVILPYDEKDYNKRTSGILQESIFLGTIPITYKSILKANNLERSGTGINSLDDLLTMDLRAVDMSVIDNNKYLICTRYNKETVKEKVLRAFL